MTALTDLINLGEALSVPCKVLHNGVTLYDLHKTSDKLTQLIILPSWTDVPEHSHPDVRKWVYPIFGAAYASREGRFKWLLGPDKGYFIDADIKHSVRTTGDKFIYLSVQQWLNGVAPTSIELNWKEEENAKRE